MLEGDGDEIGRFVGEGEGGIVAEDLLGRDEAVVVGGGAGRSSRPWGLLPSPPTGRKGIDSSGDFGHGGGRSAVEASMEPHSGKKSTGGVGAGW